MKQIQPPSTILELPNIHYRIIIDLIYDLYLYIYLNLSIFLIYSKINLNEKKNTQLTLFTQQCMFCYHLIFNTTALQLFMIKHEYSKYFILPSDLKNYNIQLHKNFMFESNNI